MLYAAMIAYPELPDIANRLAEHRPAHRAYLLSLHQAGQLALAGPFTNDRGALIIYQAESPEAVIPLIENDPFHRAGIFVSWRIEPWRSVFANAELLPNLIAGLPSG